jgi:hypothetical protein
MKLIAVSRVKNEIDIIEAFVRHHARHFDKLIILDDGSTDGTYDMLQCLRDAGLPQVLLREASVGYEQSRYMTRLLHVAAQQFGADWVAPLDADEFVELPEGTTLAALLAARDAAPVALRWSNFVWPSEGDTDHELNPVLRLRRRMPAYRLLTKTLVPAALMGQGHIELTQGNHAVLCNGREVPATPLDSVALCHFPIRSLAQYAAKIAVGYLQYSATARWDRLLGRHYIKPFALLTGGLDQLALSMAAESRRYSLDEDAPYDGEPQDMPLRYLGGPLLFTPRREEMLANILFFAESLARERAAYAERNDSLCVALAVATPELADAPPQTRILSLQAASLTARDARDALARELERLRPRLSDLEDQLATARGHLLEAKDQLAAAENKLGTTLEQFAAAEDQLAEARAQIDTLTGDTDFLEGRVAQLEAERVKLRETVYRQEALLSSRTFRLAQRLQVSLARTGLPTRAIADRLSQLFGAK